MAIAWIPMCVQTTPQDVKPSRLQQLTQHAWLIGVAIGDGCFDRCGFEQIEVQVHLGGSMLVIAPERPDHLAQLWHSRSPDRCAIGLPQRQQCSRGVQSCGGRSPEPSFRQGSDSAQRIAVTLITTEDPIFPTLRSLPNRPRDESSSGQAVHVICRPLSW